MLNAKTQVYLSPAAAQDQMSIFMDKSRAPTIRVTLNGEVSDGAFTKYLADSDQLLATGQCVGLIFDGLRPFALSPRQRRAQSIWLRKNENSIAKLCVGAAFVIDSAASRGVLTALMWMTKLPYTYVIVKSTYEAQTWITERLRAAGIPQYLP